MPKPIKNNTLFYGDNLAIMREYIPDESVDLIYLDPPFNSNRSYNVLFKDESGKDAEAQITAFEDTWHWGQETENTYQDIILDGAPNVGSMISALRDFIGTNQMMAYLVMMTARLIELHRVLKPTGSIYLHCDPTASHYLKIVMDTIFSTENFRNEIIWKRSTSHNDAKRKFADVSDTLFFYSKSKEFYFSVRYKPYSEEYISKFYRYVDKDGRRYRLDNSRSPSPRPNLVYDYKGYKPHPNGWSISLEKMKQFDAEGRLHFPKSKDGRIQWKKFLDEMPGVPVSNVWDDIRPIHAHASERLGYPTQKPLDLLERILNASSNEGDIILDPFCGCGTAVAAAEKLKRKWIGIDVTHLSISLMKYRLKDNFELEEKKDYQVIGEPESLASAHHLAQKDRFQFEWWALSLIKAKPQGGSGGKRGKKGADQGIDGVLNFIDARRKKQSILVQVKSGHVKSGDIRDLRGVVERENAAMGLFITLEEPSRPMIKEAASAGVFHSKVWQQNYPRIQILTIEELLDGKNIQMPPSMAMFKKAERIKKDMNSQPDLL